MAMAHHASGGTVAAVYPWASEAPTVGGGEACRGVEGLSVGVASSWSSALPERMEHCDL